MTKEQIEASARACHEANRAYCISLGDFSQKPWEDAGEKFQASSIEGVTGILNGNGPRECHESWMANRLADGWKLGPTKDEEKKEHPCLVDYDKLPPEQLAKDTLYVAVARAMALAFGE